MNQTYINRTIRFFLVIFIVIAALLAIYFLSKITYPFLIGLAIAFLMNPLVDFLEKKGECRVF